MSDIAHPVNPPGLPVLRVISVPSKNGLLPLPMKITGPAPFRKSRRRHKPFLPI